MEWGNALSTGNIGSTCNEVEEGLLFVKVMTDEQMEVLRRQISIYAAICEQLVEMHRSITAHRDSIAGMRLGSLYCDPLMISGGSPKITARQRWTPTPMQLKILENIFEHGTGTPSKQKIKEIASDLMQHGQISETNVYNWFQNRRARSKRKQTTAALPNGAESEAEVETHVLKEMKGKSDEKICSSRSPEVSSEVCFMNQEPLNSLSNSDISMNVGSLGQVYSIYTNGLTNPRM